MDGSSATRYRENQTRAVDTKDAIRAANNPTIPSEDMTKWINVGLDKSISDSKCYPLVAGKCGCCATVKLSVRLESTATR